MTLSQQHSEKAPTSGAHRPRRWAMLLTAALVIAPAIVTGAGSASASSVSFNSVPGGPVVLDGNDPADHEAQTTAYIRNVYRNLDANVANGYVDNGKVAVVGACKAMLDRQSTGETFEQFNSATAVAGLFGNIGANNYRHIHICSDEDNTLAAPVQTELNNWGSAIVTHVNRGGGLFSTGHDYVWLTDLFPSLVVTFGGTGSSYVTAAGATFFSSLPENTQVNAINHYTFTGESSTPLQALLTASPNGAGLRVALGGRTVRFPQISVSGPSVSDVGTSQAYTLTAATADGTLLSNNSFNYVISGPTSAATSGTAITDANGQYTFNFAGNARGRTTVRVTMTLAGGTSAGDSASTQWVSLAYAPTNLTTVDVTGEPGNVQLSWTAPVNPGATPAVTDYVLERSTDGITWTTISDGTSTATSYKVTGLDPTIPYVFRVAAVNADGNSAWSNLSANRPYLPNAVTFPAVPDRALSAGATSPAASASSGLPVTLTSATPSVCTVSGAVVTPTSVGTCTLTASQDGDATYQAATSVTQSFLVLPAAPAPPTVTTTGTGTGNQTGTVTVPTGGQITLLDTAGQPAGTVTVPGEGTYAVDAATGTIVFTPAPGFSGVGTGVVFRVTDAYGQSGTGRFTPTVQAAAAAPTTTATATVTIGGSRPAKVLSAGGSVPTSCWVTGSTVSSCIVNVYATVRGQQVLMGTGTVTYATGAEPVRALTSVTLNARGKALMRKPGGRKVTVVATVVPTTGKPLQAVVTGVRLLPKSLRVRPVFFNPSSAKIRPSGLRYLHRLRAQLGPVTDVRCVGYTDWDGRGKANVSLGMARAKAVCRYLTRGLKVTKHLSTKGERKPFATNHTHRGKAFNRRTMITLGY